MGQGHSSAERGERGEESQRDIDPGPLVATPHTWRLGSANKPDILQDSMSLNKSKKSKTQMVHLKFRDRYLY